MELGLFRHITDDAGNLKGGIIAADLEGAADYIGAVEIAAGGAFIDHEGGGVVEGGIGIAGDHGQSEDLEDRRVGKSEAVVKDEVVALPHQQVARMPEPDHLLDLRIASDESGAEKFGGVGGGVPGVIDV